MHLPCFIFSQDSRHFRTFSLTILYCFLLSSTKICESQDESPNDLFEKPKLPEQSLHHISGISITAGTISKSLEVKTQTISLVRFCHQVSLKKWKMITKRTKM